MEEPITNTVARNEDLVVFNLQDLWDKREIVELDIKEFLFKGLIVKEEPFRESIQEHDWTRYADKHVAIYCSEDAILPQWATMLVASRLKDRASSVALGRSEDLLREYYAAALEAHDWSGYEDRIVLIKGCGSEYVPDSAYVQAVCYLQSTAQKLMYGEACSNVPIWRESKKQNASTDTRSAGVKKPDLPTS
jgi:hypothetical protein